MSVSSFCFSSSSHPTASGDPSQPMNPVTSALISGVVILGGVSVGFFLLSVRLLQKSRLLTTRASGVCNPSFKWINICIWWHLGTDNIYTDVKKKKKKIMYMCMCAFFCTHIIKCLYCIILGVVYLLPSIPHSCYSLLTFVWSITVFTEDLH